VTVPMNVPELVRPEFFDGQLLDAADLTAVQDFHRELRWLHNRALHGWGIAAGFVVAGAKGARVVRVAPGYALDCLGHDIVLARAVELPVPPVAGGAGGAPVRYYLTASYAADEQLASLETREGACEGGGAVRRAEAPRLRWQRVADVTPEQRYRRGLDIILATALVESCRLAKPLSAAERRDARPAAQPYVAAGQTPAGATPWRFAPSSGTPIGVETVVDTSGAGFRTAPVYTATVLGSRVVASPGGAGGGRLADGFAEIADPTPTAFRLRLTMPRDVSMPPYTLNPSPMFTKALLDTLEKKLAWSVAWMGVEG